MLKPNRCTSAWWIWVPLGCVAGVGAAPEWLLELLHLPQAKVLLEMAGTAGFGMAAVWLLASYVAWKHRMVGFVAMLFVQGLFALLLLGLRLGLEGGGYEALGFGVWVGAGAGIISLGLTLAGLLCRGRYGWLRLSLWLVGMLAGLWLLLMAPFFAIAVVSSEGGIALLDFLPALGLVTALTFGVVLPFLVLSFANGFYRERLKGLLHLGRVAPPPMITPRVPAMPEVGGG